MPVHRRHTAIQIFAVPLLLAIEHYRARVRAGWRRRMGRLVLDCAGNSDRALRVLPAEAVVRSGWLRLKPVG